MQGSMRTIVLTLISTTLLLCIPAKAHDGYDNWLQPRSKLSCCNNNDCRPTRAYKDEAGYWHAWNGTKWLIVPPYALLESDLKKDGRSHLCESNGVVFCFSPAEPKS